jgi:hypothetical protein
MKTILGWIVNTMSNNIALPYHHLLCLREILTSICLGQRRVALKQWQQILGELHSMALAIPAAIGLFSVLQDALKSSDGHIVRLTPTHTPSYNTLPFLSKTWVRARRRSRKLFRTLPLPLTVLVTHRASAWEGYTLSHSAMDKSCPCSGVAAGPPPSPNASSPAATHTSPAPTASWNSLPP